MTNAPASDLAADRPPSSPLKATLNAWLAAGQGVIRQQIWLLVVMLGYIALGIGIGRWYGQSVKVSLYNEVVTQLFVAFALAAICTRTVRVLLRYKPERPLRFLLTDFRARYLTPERVLAPLPVLFLTGPFISVVSSVKRLIPIMNPYDWDARFAELDRILHGGLHPWELLHPLLAHPYATSFISEFYSYPWFVGVALLQFWFVFTVHTQRSRLIMTSLLSWILIGNLSAAAFSSAGPVYYAHFVAGPDPYGTLLDYLRGVDAIITLSALKTQAFLWSMYESGTLLPGTGISAMPSMHLSMGTVMVLTARQIGPRLTYCAVAYLVFLQIGSVHLAWHYAIDGYFGIAATLAIWWLLGRLTKR